MQPLPAAANGFNGRLEKTGRFKKRRKRNAEILENEKGKESVLPPRLVPPALRPDGEQGLGQPLQAQTRQSRSHRKPHVAGPSLTRSPGCPEHQLSLLQGAVEQTDLRRGGGRRRRGKRRRGRRVEEGKRKEGSEEEDPKDVSWVYRHL